MNDEVGFEQLRGRLLGIAYRILGTMSDAEDVVQETWIAWQGVDAGTVANPAAYLSRMAGNRALNRLRERTRRREDYIGPWLPEPIDSTLLPDEAAEVAESLSFAMLVVLEQLSPLERAAFVLREVFDVPTAETAHALGRSPDAVRQLVSRARRQLRTHGASQVVPGRSEQWRIAGELVDAVRAGDVPRALQMLSPAVHFTGDGGGKVSATMRPISGADPVVRTLIGLATKYADARYELREANGGPALVVQPADEPPTVLLFGVSGGLITDIWGVRNPDKLVHLST